MGCVYLCCTFTVNICTHVHMYQWTFFVGYKFAWHSYYLRLQKCNAMITYCTYNIINADDLFLFRFCSFLKGPSNQFEIAEESLFNRRTLIPSSIFNKCKHNGGILPVNWTVNGWCFPIHAGQLRQAALLVSYWLAFSGRGVFHHTANKNTSRYTVRNALKYQIFFQLCPGAFPSHFISISWDSPFKKATATWLAIERRPEAARHRAKIRGLSPLHSIRTPVTVEPATPLFLIG